MTWYRSRGQMRSKKATLIESVFILVLILGCHAFSAHCGRQLDGCDGDGQTGPGSIKIRPLPGKCLKSRCAADHRHSVDSISSCFCCLSTPENPCFRNEADCAKVCRPQVLPPWSPPPPASSGGASD